MVFNELRVPSRGPALPILSLILFAGCAPESAPTGYGFTASEKATVNLSSVRVGQLLITEIMSDPTKVPDPRGEYFEIYNTTVNDVDLNGLIVTDRSGQRFTVTTSTIIAAGDYFVFGANSSSARNGGLTVDYAYDPATFSFAANDAVIISSSTRTIDRVVYSNNTEWAMTAGVALTLDTDNYLSSENDWGDAWCAATTAYGSGDFGNPGSAGENCADRPADRDRDGYTTDVDCNDGDATINPAASDPTVDGVDQNCDGTDGPIVTDPLAGVVECPPDAGYPDLSASGMQIKRYCLTSSHMSGYRDNTGLDPAFNVVWPITWADPTADHPVLLQIHGGAIGIDDRASADRACKYSDGTGEGIASLVTEALSPTDPVLFLAHDADWFYVIPENTWCDLWVGLGDLDPVDTNHKGLLHVETMLDVLSAGLDGFQIDESQIYAWGTSIGAAGAWAIANGYPEDPHPIAGIVTDSGPFDVVSWYGYYTSNPSAGYSDYSRMLTHILGGSPYESDGVTQSAYWSNYARSSVPLLIDAGLRVPAFVVYNQYDGLVEPIHGPAAEAALEAYDTDGVRYFAQDYAHHGPVGRNSAFHTQTRNTGIPWVYTTVAAFEFLGGATVNYIEAEDLCEVGACDFVHEDEAEFCPDPTDATACYGENTPAEMVNGTAARRLATSGAGTLFRGTLPADLPRGVPLTIRPVVKFDNLPNLGAAYPLLTVTWSQGGTTLGTQTVKFNQVPRATPNDAEDCLTQVEATVQNTDFNGDGVREGLPEGDVTVTLTTNSKGDIYFDGFWISEE